MDKLLIFVASSATIAAVMLAGVAGLMLIEHGLRALL